MLTCNAKLFPAIIINNVHSNQSGKYSVCTQKTDGSSTNSYHVRHKTIKNDIGRHVLSKNGHQLQRHQLAIAVL